MPRRRERSDGHGDGAAPWQLRGHRIRSTSPRYRLCLLARAVCTTHPQTLGVPPPPQVWPAGQLPHWRRPPQPSPAGPQLTPSAAQVVGVHALPQTKGVPPPPQVWPAGQLPHWMTPPQPSPEGPHCTPSAAQVVGVQLCIRVVVVVVGAAVVEVLVARISGAQSIFGVLGVTVPAPN